MQKFGTFPKLILAALSFCAILSCVKNSPYVSQPQKNKALKISLLGLKKALTSGDTLHLNIVTQGDTAFSKKYPYAGEITDTFELVPSDTAWFYAKVYNALGTMIYSGDTSIIISETEFMQVTINLSINVSAPTFINRVMLDTIDFNQIYRDTLQFSVAPIVGGDVLGVP